MSDISWAHGWAFYKSGGTGSLPAGDSPADLLDWMKGFGAALADHDLDGQHPSIQAALLHYGIDGDLLEDCLQAAELIVEEPTFNRWPSVPIRGFGDSSALKTGPFVLVLPKAANDEMG
jgi:hypothetical protein